MKTRRLFQVASGILSLVFAIAVLVIAILAVIPLLSHSEASGIAADIVNAIPQFTEMDATVYILISFVLPALLWVVAAIIMFTKWSKKRKQGKYKIASLLIFAATVLFLVFFELHANDFFGKSGVAWMIVTCVGGVVLLAFTVVSLVAKVPKLKKKVASVGASGEKKSDAPQKSASGKTSSKKKKGKKSKKKSSAAKKATKPISAPVAKTEVKEEVQEKVVEEIPLPDSEEPKNLFAEHYWQKDFEQRRQQKATEQDVDDTALAEEIVQPKIVDTPEILKRKTDGDQRPALSDDSDPVPDTVEGIVTLVYGDKKLTDLDKTAVHKLKKLRSQWKSGEISQDEYIAQLHAQLAQADAIERAEAEIAAQKAAREEEERARKEAQAAEERANAIKLETPAESDGETRYFQIPKFGVVEDTPFDTVEEGEEKTEYTISDADNHNSN